MDEKENKNRIARIADLHHLLHRAVAADNLEMTEFLIGCGACINLEDHHSRSPLFHAVKHQNKSMIQLLSRNGGRVICFHEDLFEIFVDAVKKDDIEFFNLLYHIEFK